MSGRICKQDQVDSLISFINGRTLHYTTQSEESETVGCLGLAARVLRPQAVAAVGEKGRHFKNQWEQAFCRIHENKSPKSKGIVLKKCKQKNGVK